MSRRNGINRSQCGDHLEDGWAQLMYSHPLVLDKNFAHRGAERVQSHQLGPSGHHVHQPHVHDLHARRRSPAGQRDHGHGNARTDDPDRPPSRVLARLRLRPSRLRLARPHSLERPRISSAIPARVLARAKDFLSVQTAASGHDMPECPAQNRRVLHHRPRSVALFR